MTNAAHNPVDTEVVPPFVWSPDRKGGTDRRVVRVRDESVAIPLFRTGSGGRPDRHIPNPAVETVWAATK